ncbi:hypothetical protein DLAC_07999 [Tieghemostelium lacteum]|uniref:Uncharacterized protein n=1 Tax=Tieghemostelium lacteum TaxID=361077 RepID=A0A151ZAY4_TIELA|nr:hypothetical protein DLAC_07999 [Tieghemostelium lacteum]|eukprot:KYQ91095.1 hypothetical protein DLAC_07999 [Tieghemostelium lacteum]
MNKKTSKPAASAKKEAESTTPKVQKTKEKSPKDKMKKKTTNQILMEGNKKNTVVANTARIRTPVERSNPLLLLNEPKKKVPTVPFYPDVSPVGENLKITKAFTKFTDHDLQSALHHIIFQRKGKAHEKLKNNILTQFRGFKVSTEEQKENILDRINKLKKDELTQVLTHFCLPLSSTKEAMVTTLYGFFIDPHGVEFTYDDESEEEVVVKKPAKKSNKRKTTDTTQSKSKKDTKKPNKEEEVEEEQEEEKEEEEETVEETKPEPKKPSKKVITPAVAKPKTSASKKTAKSTKGK